MRGICPARPRFSAARAFIAGAAFLAGVASPTFSPAQAQENYEDTALAVPRFSLPGGGAPMPRPLPAALARLISQAFKDPATPLDALQDSPLLGHILADRHLAAPSRPTVAELRDWLDRFAGQPDAPAIHALLASRLPKGAAPPPPALPQFAAAPPGDDIEASDRLLPRNPALDRAVRDAARTGQFDRAIRLATHTKDLAPEYAATLRAEIARAMFSQGKDLEALALADEAYARTHGSVGLAPWVGGLAAWRLGRFDLARTLFEAAYRARLIDPGQRAGAAYWTARANLMTQGDHGPWMQRAARDPRTFYGLLARRVLGQPIEASIPAYDRDTLANADVDAVAATPRGERAFALLQVDQPTRAAAELRLLFTERRDQPGFGRSVLLVARAAGLTDLAAQLGAVMQPAAVRLPASQLRPAGGFRFDPALVYALTRIESNFDPAAVSPAGARGLMQLMPVTAQFVMQGAAPHLHDPATNLDVGQRYMTRLVALESIGADLIRLVASYNAGPGNFSRWLDVMQRENDPLLFIEALPGEETRAYVPRALAYTWLYAAQLGLPSPSLDELAAGLWPRVQVRPARRDIAVRLH
jgi:soluble lytic murein transglycosylase